ncbi:MAG: methionyl-tRNA formyltransferase [Bradymonadia bacterium]
MPLKTIFMGTPDFAVPSLRALHSDPRVDVCLVVSQPDKRSGRGNKLRATPVKAAAMELEIPTFQPDTLRTPEAIERLQQEGADLFVVAAYGQILRKSLLETPRLGCVNVHASLLPRWRGAAPIHRAIAAGDAVTGVSIMRMERGLDTGPVYQMATVMIGDTETAGELHDRLGTLGADLLVECLPVIESDDFIPTPQPTTRTTYAKMLGAEDKTLSFEGKAENVVARINGMSPAPGARTSLAGEVVTVMKARVSSVEESGPPGQVLAASMKAGLHVAAGEGAVEFLELKRPGKRAMSAQDCLNGMTIEPGELCIAVE